MTSLTFTKQTDGKKVFWESTTITALSGTALVDMSRDSIGAIKVFGRLTGTSGDYKRMGVVEDSFNSPGVIFQVANDSDNATIDVKIVSYTKDQPTGYYA